jgi:hypothetical protein
MEWFRDLLNEALIETVAGLTWRFEDPATCAWMGSLNQVQQSQVIRLIETLEHESWVNFPESRWKECSKNPRDQKERKEPDITVE